MFKFDSIEDLIPVQNGESVRFGGEEMEPQEILKLASVFTALQQACQNAVRAKRDREAEESRRLAYGEWVRENQDAILIHDNVAFHQKDGGHKGEVGGVDFFREPGWSERAEAKKRALLDCKDLGAVVWIRFRQGRVWHQLGKCRCSDRWGWYADAKRIVLGGDEPPGPVCAELRRAGVE